MFTACVYTVIVVHKEYSKFDFKFKLGIANTLELYNNLQLQEYSMEGFHIGALVIKTNT